MKNEKTKKGNLAATIVGVIIFAITYFLTAYTNRVTAANPEGAGALRGMVGVFSQLQVLGIIIMVVFDRKRGFIVGMLLQATGFLQIIAIQLLLRHNFTAAPGAVTGIVSMREEAASE